MMRMRTIFLLAGTQISLSQGEQESISQAQVISKSHAHDHDNGDDGLGSSVGDDGYNDDQNY